MDDVFKKDRFREAKLKESYAFRICTGTETRQDGGLLKVSEKGDVLLTARNGNVRQVSKEIFENEYHVAERTSLCYRKTPLYVRTVCETISLSLSEGLLTVFPGEVLVYETTDLMGTGLKQIVAWKCDAVSASNMFEPCDRNI